MSNFSSTLDLPNLTGFDTGVPGNLSTSSNFLLKLFFIILFVGGLCYYFYSLGQKKEREIAKKLKLRPS